MNEGAIRVTAYLVPASRELTALPQYGGDGTASFLTGDIVVVRTYTATLTATQRAINKAVDEWRLGGSFPVTP